MKKFNFIMLIDDDEISNFITEKMITSLMLSDRMHTLKNGIEALTFINKNCNSSSNQCPDLIILDINMPVMDGIEFLEEFYSNKKSKNPNDPNIYILSSSYNPHDTEKIKKFNIKGYITKPMTLEKLMGIVN
jgi:CheY-like chemotaxis protein